MVERQADGHETSSVVRLAVPKVERPQTMRLTRPVVIFDLDGVERVDNAVVAEVLRVRKGAMAVGARHFVLRGASTAMQATLRLLRLDTLFKIETAA